MFYVCFFTTAYWFIFYKMQKNAKLLLPSFSGFNEPYEFFHIFFLVILATKTIAVFMKIVIQSKADIFIMDWEKPKQGMSADGRSKSGIAGTVAWRSIFVANEINELQV